MIHEAIQLTHIIILHFVDRSLFWKWYFFHICTRLFFNFLSQTRNAHYLTLTLSSLKSVNSRSQKLIFKYSSDDSKIPVPYSNQDDLRVKTKASWPAPKANTVHAISIISFAFSGDYVCSLLHWLEENEISLFKQQEQRQFKLYTNVLGSKHEISLEKNTIIFWKH